MRLTSCHQIVPFAHSYRFILFILCFGLTFSSFGRDSIDSLKMIISTSIEKPDITHMVREARKSANQDLNQAIAYMKVAEEIAIEQHNYKELYTIYRKIGFIYEDHDQPGQALVAFEQALRVVEQHLEHKDEYIAIYNNLALTYERLGQYKVARDYFHKAIEIGRPAKQFETIEYSYHGLGLLYRTIGDNDKAIENFQQAEAIAKSIDSQLGLVTAKRSLASTYSNMNEQALALDYIQEAYEISNQLNDTILTANVLYEYGDIYTYAKEYITAFNKYERAATIFANKQYFSSLVRAKMAMANMAEKRNQIPTAYGLYSQCLDYQLHTNKKTLAELYFQIGTLRKVLGDTIGAEEALLHSLNICKKNEFKEICQHNSYALYALYNELNQYDKALAHLENVEQLKDEIYSDKKKKRITELQFKYDVEKSETEIHTLQLRQNKLYLLGFVSLCGVVILFLFFVVGLRGRNSTLLKKKSEEIQKQHTKLKESNEVLKQFAYVAAHDLKEPLRNIGSFVNLLQNRYGNKFNEEAQEYMGFVTNGAKRMNNLLEDLLEYSRISAEDPTNEEINIKEVIEEVQSNLKEQIQRTKASIICGKDMPPVRMNRLHLVQLFQNLISNAIKFVEGEPVIIIDCKEEEEYVTISVQDNGIGIDESYGNKIFNLFHQLNKNNKYEGTGIGLTIVKNIVDKYDGKIKFTSELNKGTTFYISILNAPQEMEEGTPVEQPKTANILEVMNN